MNTITLTQLRQDEAFYSKEVEDRRRRYERVVVGLDQGGDRAALLKRYESASFALSAIRTKIEELEDEA